MVYIPNVPIKQISHKFEHEEETRVLENKNGDTISEDTEIEKRWTEYINELYNYPINPDPNTLILEKLSIFKSEVENTIQNLKKSKATRVTIFRGSGCLSTVEPNLTT